MKKFLCYGDSLAYNIRINDISHYESFMVKQLNQ